MSQKESQCENCMEKKTREEVQNMLKKYSSDKDNLIRILEDIQEKFGYIPQVAQLEVSDHLKMPLAEIYGVITFYSRFTTEPKGKYNVSICLGTACFVKGSEKLLDKAKQMLDRKSVKWVIRCRRFPSLQGVQRRSEEGSDLHAV